jgi:hypothetical protein
VPVPGKENAANARPQCPVAAMIRGLLPGTDLCDGIALSRVSSGLGPSWMAGGWKRGQTCTGIGTATRIALVERMRVTLTKPQLWCIARAVLTEGRHLLAPVLDGSTPQRRGGLNDQQPCSPITSRSLAGRQLSERSRTLGS